LAAFKAFSEKLGISKISTTEEGANTSEAYDLLQKSGKSFESKFSEVKDSDCYLVFGEDLTKNHQVISFFVKRTLPDGAKLIQICESDTGFDNFVNHSLFVKKGETANLLNTLASIIESKATGDLKAVAKKFEITESILIDAVKVLTDTANLSIIAGERNSTPKSDSLGAGLALAKSLNAKIISTKGSINSLGAAQLQFDNPIDPTGSDAVFLAVGDENLSQQFIKKFENASCLVVLSS